MSSGGGMEGVGVVKVVVPEVGVGVGGWMKE